MGWQNICCTDSSDRRRTVRCHDSELWFIFFFWTCKILPYHIQTGIQNVLGLTIIWVEGVKWVREMGDWLRYRVTCLDLQISTPYSRIYPCWMGSLTTQRRQIIVCRYSNHPNNKTAQSLFSWHTMRATAYRCQSRQQSASSLIRGSVWGRISINPTIRTLL